MNQDKEIQDIETRLTTLEQGAFSTNPNVHPQTVANLKNFVKSGVAGVAQIIAGTNVTVSPLGGTGTVTVNATGNSVSSVSGSGAGINVSPTTGAVVVSNTGVTSIVAGSNVTISGSTGAVTINSTGGTGIGSSQFFVGTGGGGYTTTSGTLSDVDSTNLKPTISGLSVGSLLHITICFQYSNTSNIGSALLEFNDITNSSTVFTFENSNGPSTVKQFYATALYKAPSTSVQFSLQWNCGGNGASLIENSTTTINGNILQSFAASGNAVSVFGANQSVWIWIQQLT